MRFPKKVKESLQVVSDRCPLISRIAKSFELNLSESSLIERSQEELEGIKNSEESDLSDETANLINLETELFNQ